MRKRLSPLFFALVSVWLSPALSHASDKLYQNYMPVGQGDQKRLSYQHDINFPYTEQHLASIDFTGKTVVEVGCGSGVMLRYFSERVGPEGRVIAIDSNKEQLVLAQQEIDQHGLLNVTLVEADITKLTEAQQLELFGEADIVFNRFVLMHLQKDALLAAIQNIHSLLKPGGIWLSEETDITKAYSDYRNDMVEQYRTLFISGRAAQGLDPLINQSVARFAEQVQYEVIKEITYEKLVTPEEFRQTVFNLKPVLEKQRDLRRIKQELIDDWMKAAANTPTDAKTYLNGLHCLTAIK